MFPKEYIKEERNQKTYYELKNNLKITIHPYFPSEKIIKNNTN